jgi:hypothetical protein
MKAKNPIMTVGRHAMRRLIDRTVSLHIAKKLISTRGFTHYPTQKFNFRNIQDILYDTAFKYYTEYLPLPYAVKAGYYKALPVPRKIHFIWIGSDVPRKYIWNIFSFTRVNPQHEVLLWVENRCYPIEGVEVRAVDRNSLVNSEIYERANNIGVRADLLRMEIVLEHGGIYNDIDAVALQPFNNLFDSPFLAYEPRKWKDIGNLVFGFAKNDPFLKDCVYNLREHFHWIVSERRDLLAPTGDNVGCLCGGAYIMSQLFRWKNLDELAFISQDYLVRDSGIGFTKHTMDAAWIKNLQSIQSLYEEGSVAFPGSACWGDSRNE